MPHTLPPQAYPFKWFLDCSRSGNPCPAWPSGDGKIPFPQNAPIVTPLVLLNLRHWHNTCSTEIERRKEDTR